MGGSLKPGKAKPKVNHLFFHCDMKSAAEYAVQRIENDSSYIHDLQDIFGKYYLGSNAEWLLDDDLRICPVCMENGTHLIFH